MTRGEIRTAFYAQVRSVTTVLDGLLATLGPPASHRATCPLAASATPRFLLRPAAEAAHHRRLVGLVERHLAEATDLLAAPPAIG